MIEIPFVTDINNMDTLNENFKKHLSNSGILVLCNNASYGVNIKNKEGELINMVNITCYLLNHNRITLAQQIIGCILKSLAESNHNCISFRAPIDILYLGGTYKGRVRFLTGKDVDPKIFKARVKKLSPHIFKKEAA